MSSNARDLSGVTLSSRRDLSGARTSAARDLMADQRKCVRARARARADLSGGGPQPRGTSGRGTSGVARTSGAAGPQGRGSSAARDFRGADPRSVDSAARISAATDSRARTPGATNGADLESCQSAALPEG